MSDLRTAAQQALDYWEQVAWGDAVMVDKMDALRAALAEQPLTELPPLPEPAGKLYSYNYTADQMRDYARAAIAKAEENT